MPRGRFRKAALLAGAWLALAVVCLGRPAFAQFDNHPPPPRFDPPIKTDLLPNFWGTRLPIPDWADEDTVETVYVTKIKVGSIDDVLLGITFNAKLDSESSILLGKTYQEGERHHQVVRLSDGRVVGMANSTYVSGAVAHSSADLYLEVKPYQEVPTRFARDASGGVDSPPSSILFNYENEKWHTERYGLLPVRMTRS